MPTESAVNCDESAGAYATGGGARGSCRQWLHDSPQLTGEAVMSAGNSGKPSGGRGLRTSNPAGGAHSASPDLLDGGERVAAQEPHPGCRPMVSPPMKNHGQVLPNQVYNGNRVSK